jgi:Peptidase C39 family
MLQARRATGSAAGLGRRVQAGLLFVLAVGGSLPILPSGTVAAPSEDLERWRVPERDGVNCLYLFLHMSGQPVEYPSIQRALRKEGAYSLLDLRDAARRLGVNASVRKWNPETLWHSRVPVVAYVERLQGGRAGSFVLFLGGEEDTCSYIDSATAVIMQVPADNFRRGWTGYVLVPGPSKEAWGASVSWWLSGGAGVVILVGYWWWRVRPALAKVRPPATASVP